MSLVTVKVESLFQKYSGQHTLNTLDHDLKNTPTPITGPPNGNQIPHIYNTAQERDRAVLKLILSLQIRTY